MHRLVPIAASAALVLAIQGVQAPVSPAERPSSVVTAAQSEVAAKGPFGEFRRFFTGETRSLRDLLTGVAVVEPGQEIHPPHQHAEEEFLFLVRGEGTWSLNGKEFPAHEGDQVYVAPWDMHGLKNTGKAPLTFAVVKWNGKQLATPERH